MEYTHIPVMQEELVQFIESSRHGGKGVLVDCTVGEGGHSELFLKKFPDLSVVAFDRDGSILDIARERLEPYGKRIDFINDNFSHIHQHLVQLKSAVQYILYDFGISSFHFETEGRGFSFAKDERLDMRLDEGSVSAHEIVNTYKEKMLADIIYNFGEERWSRKIAAYICRARETREIETTGELAGIVMRAIPRRFHVKNIHPATRVFQALRIASNDELAAIEKSLESAHTLLAPGGRMMAISFHSLEDRIVKEKFRRLAKGCTCAADPRECRCQEPDLVKILTKKPLRPDVGEIDSNSRARSARLRVCEKI